MACFFFACRGGVKPGILMYIFMAAEIRTSLGSDAGLGMSSIFIEWVAVSGPALYLCVLILGMFCNA